MGIITRRAGKFFGFCVGTAAVIAALIVAAGTAQQQGPLSIASAESVIKLSPRQGRPAKTLDPGFYRASVAGERAWLYDTGDLYRTSDGGRSWEVLAGQDGSSLGLEKYGAPPQLYFVSPTRGWLASARTGTWQSDDGGLSWRRLSKQEYGGIAFASPESGWMATYNQETNKYSHYVTQDMGATWRPCITATDDVALSVFFLNKNVGWGIVESGRRQDPSRKTKVIQTTNGGCDWSVLEISQPDIESYGDLYFLNEREGWVTGAYVGGLQHTTTGGKTWNPLPVPRDVLFANVYFATSKEGWIIGSGPGRSTEDSGLYRTKDAGLHWEAVKIADIGSTQLPERWGPGKMLQFLYR